MSITLVLMLILLSNVESTHDDDLDDIIFEDTVAMLDEEANTHLPSGCNYTSYMVICSSAASLNLNELGRSLNYQLAANFILLQSKKSFCSCRGMHLVHLVASLDVPILTSTACHFSDVKTCMPDFHLVKPFNALGLILEANDPRRRWAVSRHVMSLWRRIDTIPSLEKREAIYTFLVVALNTTIYQLLKHDFGDLADANMVNFLGEDGKMPTDEPLSEETGIPKDFAQEQQSKMVEYNFARRHNDKVEEDELFPESSRDMEMDSSEAILMKNLFQKLHSMSVDFLHEANEKNKKNEKTGKKEKKRLRRSQKKLQEEDHGISYRGISIGSILPHKVLLGGEVYNIMDTMAIQTVLDVEKQIELAKSPKDSMKKLSKNPAEVVLMADANTALKTILEDLDEGLEEEGMGVYNRFLDNGDDFVVEQAKKTKKIDADSALMDDWMGRKGPDNAIEPIVITEIHSSTADEDASNGTLAGGANYDYDHRIKQFVIFFIAMIGILSIIIALLILAVKEKRIRLKMAETQTFLPHLDPMQKPSMGRRDFMKLVQQMDDNRGVKELYDGAEDDVEPSISQKSIKGSSLPKWMKKGRGGVFNKKVDEKETLQQLDKLAESKYFKKDQPMTSPMMLLGGGHAVTTFTDVHKTPRKLLAWEGQISRIEEEKAQKKRIAAERLQKEELKPIAFFDKPSVLGRTTSENLEYKVFYPKSKLAPPVLESKETNPELNGEGQDNNTAEPLDSNLRETDSAGAQQASPHISPSKDKEKGKKNRKSDDSAASLEIDPTSKSVQSLKERLFGPGSRRNLKKQTSDTSASELTSKSKKSKKKKKKDKKDKTKSNVNSPEVESTHPVRSFRLDSKDYYFSLP